MAETILERQTRMEETINRFNEELEKYTPAEAFGILETAKLQIHNKVLNLLRHIEEKDSRGKQ